MDAVADMVRSNDANEPDGNRTKILLAADTYREMYRDQKKFLALTPKEQDQVLDIVRRGNALRSRMNEMNGPSGIEKKENAVQSGSVNRK